MSLRSLRLLLSHPRASQAEFALSSGCIRMSSGRGAGLGPDPPRTAAPPACLRPSYSLHCRPGLRGAIPYALSLHLDLEPMEKRQLIGTTTISIVLFTILLLGGSTMPLIRFADIRDARARRRNKKDVNLSKTEKMVSAGRAGRGRGWVPTRRQKMGERDTI